jgi:hypothetical protein
VERDHGAFPPTSTVIELKLLKLFALFIDIIIYLRRERKKNKIGSCWLARVIKLKLYSRF